MEQAKLLDHGSSELWLFYQVNVVRQYDQAWRRIYFADTTAIAQVLSRML